ncbi:MAG: hypothetical protein H6595_11775 [Flavobacteriales bacterium]|nr:hypothetical protein [Flavobacteriales bacterium]MCB9168139.1 hypothetical protein [Flavobacteriales bacterium]MCB9194296.1 hypothetical protein [Flavobacteriales bacterium]
MRILPFVLLSITFPLRAQQWQLVTPVKTRSELPSVQLVSPTTGFTIDRVLGFVLKTTDAGDSWQRMPYNLTDKPQTLWMWDDQRGIIGANSGRFYRTSDGWATASSVYQPTYGNIACLAFVNDTLGWSGSQTGKLFRTIDGGATWTQQTSGTTNAITALHFVDDQLGFAAATGSILLRTEDGGATWDPLTPPGTISIRGLHFFNALTGIGVGIGGDIIRTTDGGDTWNYVTSPTAQSLLGLHVHGSTVLAMGAWGTVLRSIDQGVNWFVASLDPLDLYGAWLDDSGIGLLVGKGRVYRTVDDAITWQPVQIGTWHTRLNKVSFGDDQHGASAGWLTSGGLENGVMRTEDGGRHWTDVAAGNAQWLGVHLRPDGVGWIGGGSGANRSTTDFFASTVNHAGPSVAIRSVWAFDASTAIVAGGYVNAGCYRTTNAGSTWDHTATGNVFDLYFVNDLVGYCGGEGGSLQKTTDSGVTWQPLTSPTTADIQSIFFLNDTLGFIAGYGSGHRTTDGGQTWTYMGGIPQYSCSIFFSDPDTGYAVSVSGQVVRTVDGGDNWYNLVPEPFDAVIGDATLVDGALIAVGRYGDVYRAPLQCPATPTVPAVLDLGSQFCTGVQPMMQWYLDGQALPGDTAACITPTLPGTYTVVVTDILGCVSAPSAPLIYLPTAIQGPITEGPRVAPNPTHDAVTLEFAEGGSHGLMVLDAQGRMVRQLKAAGDRIVIDLHDLLAGTYLIRGTDRPWSVRIVRD